MKFGLLSACCDVVLFFFRVHCLITPFDLSSACFDVILFVALLRRFIFLGTIQTGKIDLINTIYQIMVTYVE